MGLTQQRIDQIEDTSNMNFHNTCIPDQRKEEKQIVIDLWLVCKTHDEIANIIGKDRSVVTKIVQKFKDESLHNLSQKPPESLKVFNLWNFGKSNDKLKYPGQIPSQIMENLLWYYTEPFDVVYDPMAGGGEREVSAW